MLFASGSVVKNLQYRRHGFEPWVGKILWRRQWHPTPVLLPGKSRGRRSLAGYSPWGHQESDTTEQLNSNENLIYYLKMLPCVLTLQTPAPPPWLGSFFPFCTELERQGEGGWEVRIRSCQAEACFWEANGTHFLWYKHRLHIDGERLVNAE